MMVAVALLGRWSLASYCHTLAKQRLEQFEYSRALSALEFAEQFGVDNAETHFLKARIFRKTGRFEDFDAALAKARTLGLAESTMDNEKLLARGQSGNLGELLGKLEDLAGGVEQFEPREVYEALVNGFLLHGRFTDAMTYIEHWEKDFPEDPNQRFYKSVLLIRYGPVRKIENAQEKAASILDKLVQEYPSHFRARLAYGDLLFDMNRIEDATRQYEICMNHPDAGIQPLLSLGRCYANLGRQEDAKKMFEQVLEQQPHNSFARGELGKLQFADEEFEQALKNLEAAYPSRRWDFDLANSLARTLEVFGRRDEAQKLFEQANLVREKLAVVQDLMTEVDLGTNEEKRFELGKLLLEYGNPETGVLYLRSVLDVNPNHAGARALLQTYFAARNGQSTPNLFSSPIRDDKNDPGDSHSQNGK